MYPTRVGVCVYPPGVCVYPPGVCVYPPGVGVCVYPAWVCVYIALWCVYISGVRVYTELLELVMWRALVTKAIGCCSRCKSGRCRLTGVR